jgi:predicted AAA+ superfamily ATPase
MDEFTHRASCAIADLLVSDTKLGNVDKLLAIYGACLETAWEIDINYYRELLERVSEANEKILPMVLAAYEKVKREQQQINPMRFFSTTDRAD